MNSVQGHAGATAQVLQGELDLRHPGPGMGTGSRPWRAGSPACALRITCPELLRGVLVLQVHTECRIGEVRLPDPRPRGLLGGFPPTPSSA